MTTTTGSVWRRLRGALGVGIAWGAAWSLVGLVLAGIEYWAQFRIQGLTARILVAVIEQAIISGLFGFVSGVLFGFVLAGLSRARWFSARSIWPFVAAGGTGMAGTMLLYLTFAANYLFTRSGVIIVAVFGWFGLLGAVSSMVTLALVRHADRRALPGSGSTALTDGTAG